MRAKVVAEKGRYDWPLLAACSFSYLLTTGGVSTVNSYKAAILRYDVMAKIVEKVKALTNVSQWRNTDFMLTWFKRASTS